MIMIYVRCLGSTLLKQLIIRTNDTMKIVKNVLLRTFTRETQMKVFYILFFSIEECYGLFYNSIPMN